MEKNSTESIKKAKGRLAEGNMYRLLGYQLAKASVVTTLWFDKLVYKTSKLRPVEFTILQLISANPGIVPTQLANELAMTTPSITNWLDKLEQKQLLIRQRSKEDGRAMVLSLTAAGATLVEKSLSSLLAGDDKLMDKLSQGERTILIELLHKITS